MGLVLCSACRSSENQMAFPLPPLPPEMLFRAGLFLSMEKKKKNHGTQDSRVVPHRGTDWAAPWLTAQIGRDAVLSESYGRG
jgi:hypothetical protein